MEEERWLNGSAPDCKSVVLGSNPAPPQHTENSVSPEVGSHLAQYHVLASEGQQRYMFWILGRGLRRALIRCTLGSVKSEKGLGFWRGGHKGAMGNKGE